MREFCSQVGLFQLQNQDQEDVSIWEGQSVCYLNVRHLRCSHFSP